MLDVPTMILQLRGNTGEDESDLTDDQCILLLNQSYWEILDKFEFREKEVTAFQQTIVGVPNYPAPIPFESIRMISIQDPNSLQHFKLDRMLPSVYENTLNDNIAQQDFPRKYVREGCLFRLWPTPNGAYNLTLKYMTVLADLDSSTNPLPPIPQVWGEIILYGATWRRYGQIGDLVRKQSFQNDQARLINSTSPVETKEEGDSKEARLEVMGQGYGGYNYGGWQ